MLLYYITDRKGLAAAEAERCSRLLHKIAQAAQAGIDYIQLREKDLAARDLERLARDAVRIVHQNSAATKLLINGRADVALASAGDGVHLPAGELDASNLRALWMQASNRPPVIAVSVHTIQEVRAAAAGGANFAVLAPIFEKPGADVCGIGIDALRAARAASHAVSKAFAILALGGVTLATAPACLAAGADGVAGIRLFQSGDIVKTVRRLRGLRPTDA